MNAGECAHLEGPSPDHCDKRGDWWRSLFDEAEDAQLICTPDATVIEFNRKAAGLFGAARAPFTPSKLAQILSASAAQKVSQLLQQPNALSQSIPGVSVLSGGRLALIADLHFTPLSPGYSLLTLKDASRRWRLESHAQRLITALDSTPDVVFLTDGEFRLTFTNAAFQNATGYTIEEALGRTAEFLRAADQAEKMADYCEKVRNGCDWVGELANVRSDGTVYPVESSISPIFDKNGEFLGSVAFERDLTAKKKLLEDLRLERNFAQSILNSLESAVYTIGRDFRLTHFNEGWKQFPAHHGWLELKSTPQAGHSLLDYIADPHKQSELKIVFESVLAEGNPREFRTAAADGHHWLIQIIPWRHEEEIRGLIYKVTDNTQFTALQNQLYQSQKMETIGALAAGVAHDFNNLLLAIRGNVSLLLLQPEIDRTAQNRLQQIENASNQASSITQQLLSFSRSSDEQVTVLDFNRVIQEASQLAARTLRGKVQIRLDKPDFPLKSRMDSTRAQQLLLNLCINAFDAMPNGGQLVISNTLVPLDRAQAAKFQQAVGAKFICCSVSDTGVGIPPEVLSRIFDPFFTTKAKGKGTGLGLAIAHSVVSKAGGFLEVESVVGQGTTFHIFLPAVQEDVTDFPGKSPAKLQSGSGRILVVDDLDLVHDFTRDFLTAAGYDVSVASSADEAIHLLEQRPVDLLLTDYNMPEKNGWQLIQEASGRWPKMKVILASGYLDENERTQVEKHHDIRILYKPYHISEATALIAELLSHKK